MSEEQPNFSRTTLLNLGGGAIVEQFDDQLSRVMANIDDLNADAKAKRTITIEVSFEPDATRQALTVKHSVKTKLAAGKKAESTIFLVRDKTGEMFAVNNNVHQPELFKG